MSSSIKDWQIEKKDLLILVALLGSVGGGVLLAINSPRIDSTVSIALVTAISVWFAGYRIRRMGSETLRRVPPVRQQFQRDDSGDLDRLILKNHGDDDAFYIQVELTDGGDNKLGEQLEPNEPPLHIETSDSIPLVDGTEAGLIDEVAPETDEIRLYYSYVGPTGDREPGEPDNDNFAEDERLIGQMYSVENPRVVRPEDVREVLDD